MEGVQQARPGSGSIKLGLFYLVTFVKTLIWSRLVIKNKNLTGYLVDGLMLSPLVVLVLFAADICPI